MIIFRVHNQFSWLSSLSSSWLLSLSFQSSVIMIIFSHHPSHHITFSSTIMEQYLTVSKLFWLSSLSSSFGWVWGRDHHQIIIIISIVIITIIHHDYYHHNCYHNQLSSFIMIIINIINIIINIRAWLGGFFRGSIILRISREGVGVIIIVILIIIMIWACSLSLLVLSDDKWMILSWIGFL